MSKQHVIVRGPGSGSTHGRRVLARRVSEGLMVDVGNQSQSTIPRQAPFLSNMSPRAPVIERATPAMTTTSSYTSIASNVQSESSNTVEVKVNISVTDNVNAGNPDRKSLMTYEKTSDSKGHSNHDKSDDPDVQDLTTRFQKLSLGSTKQKKLTQYFHMKTSSCKSKMDYMKKGVVKASLKQSNKENLKPVFGNKGSIV